MSYTEKIWQKSGPWRCHIEKQWRGDFTEMFLLKQIPLEPGTGSSGKIAWVTGFNYEETLEGDEYPAEGIRFGHMGSKQDLGHVLMNALWEAGFRPEGIQHVADAENQALKQHLADMRQLTFGKLKIDKP